MKTTFIKSEWQFYSQQVYNTTQKSITTAKFDYRPSKHTERVTQ